MKFVVSPLLLVPSHLEGPEVVQGLDEGGEPVVRDEGLLVHCDDVAVTPSDPRNRPAKVFEMFSLSSTFCASRARWTDARMRGETWWDTSLHLRFIGLLSFCKSDN